MNNNGKIKEAFKLSPEFYNLGIYLITPLLLGVFAGYWLDGKLNTKPVFVIVGILIGTIGLMYNFWKLSKNIK